MSNNAVYIASTGQNVGKTTLSLGLFHGLQKRLGSVGFLKPVGQQHVLTDGGYKADKDAVLFKEHFEITSSYPVISPVICDSGFTRDFLDHKIDPKALLKKIQASYHEIQKEHNYVLLEGTGHVGVGSIFELSNATVARALNTEVVIIASGGLGSAIDELTLNIEMLLEHGVKVKGVLLNRVKDEKREMILNYFPKALRRWNIPLIGAIPFLPYLSLPTMQDFSTKLKAPFLTGEECALRHFQSSDLVASSLDSFVKELQPDQLIITPACREDIVLEMLHNPKAIHGGMILTGSTPPREPLLEEIKKSKLPILFTATCPFEVMQQITSFKAKIQKEDTKKIARAIELVETHVNFDELLR